ncbi:hypothetical protein M501DRAFT_995542 [Patellaria atrata CBS 101060]|uniref:Uncharacterized protein n=1 Tax=Patellaria atrata CBS 101060 TaxID=1346257 RepID=A0A9P4VQ98_9PEZI|nr:hypothetical protein M501DRAFT_995542 [Patellaria atrata CBS 101060]
MVLTEDEYTRMVRKLVLSARTVRSRLLRGRRLQPNKAIPAQHAHRPGRPAEKVDGGNKFRRGHRGNVAPSRTDYVWAEKLIIVRMGQMVKSPLARGLNADRVAALLTRTFARPNDPMTPAAFRAISRKLLHETNKMSAVIWADTRLKDGSKQPNFTATDEMQLYEFIAEGKSLWCNRSRGAMHVDAPAGLRRYAEDAAEAYTIRM